MYKATIISIAGVIAAPLMAACGGSSVPHAQSAETQGAIRAADEMGAQSVPDGALHLQFARKQIGQAEKLIAAGENDKAFLVLRRAQADAELALALAKADRARTDAEAAQERIRELQQRQAASGPPPGNS